MKLLTWSPQDGQSGLEPQTKGGDNAQGRFAPPDARTQVIHSMS